MTTMNINDVKLTDAEKQAIIDTDFDAFEPFDSEFHEPVWVPAITAVENLRRADGSPFTYNSLYGLIRHNSIHTRKAETMGSRACIMVDMKEIMDYCKGSRIGKLEIIY